jgi:hypothetical protein
MLNCDVDHILQKFYTMFLARFRTYKMGEMGVENFWRLKGLSHEILTKIYRTWPN